MLRITSEWRDPRRTSIRQSCFLVLGLAAAFVGLVTPSFLAAEAPVKFVQIRIAGPEDRVLIEMPVQLLQYLAEHSQAKRQKAIESHARCQKKVIE